MALNLYCKVYLTAEVTKDDIKDIYEDICEAKGKWEDIGLQLGLTLGDLDAIGCSKRNPLLAVLKIWMNLDTDTAHTREEIIKALCSKTVAEEKLASRIKHPQQC